MGAWRWRRRGTQALNYEDAIKLHVIAVSKAAKTHCYSPDALGFSNVQNWRAVFLGRAELVLLMQLVNLILDIHTC